MLSTVSVGPQLGSGNMPYYPPTFNLLANIWDCRFPVDGPPDWLDVPVQKYIMSRPDGEKTPPVSDDWWSSWQTPVMLRFPRTHIAFAGNPTDWAHTVCEVPAGSGSYYRTCWREVLHQGFINEYAILQCVQCDESGQAIPPPAADVGLGVANNICPDPGPTTTTTTTSSTTTTTSTSTTSTTTSTTTTPTSTTSTTTSTTTPTSTTTTSTSTTEPPTTTSTTTSTTTTETTTSSTTTPTSTTSTTTSTTTTPTSTTSTTTSTTTTPTSTTSTTTTSPGGSQEFTADDTWTVPGGFTSAQFECIGGGQAGQHGTSTFGGRGGEGGGYSKKTVSVSGGQVYEYFRGDGGTGNGGIGGDSRWHRVGTNHCLAPGGGSGSAAIGDVTRPGGAGPASLAGGGGTGGGGSAGPAANGNDGVQNTGTIGGVGGTPVTGGGGGGDGGDIGAAAGPATPNGGGGGGAGATDIHSTPGKDGWGKVTW